jgi:hypothetical protein
MRRWYVRGYHSIVRIIIWRRGRVVLAWRHNILRRWRWGIILLLLLTIVINWRRRLMIVITSISRWMMAPISSSVVAALIETLVPSLIASSASATMVVRVTPISTTWLAIISFLGSIVKFHRFSK